MFGIFFFICIIQISCVCYAAQSTEKSSVSQDYSVMNPWIEKCATSQQWWSSMATSDTGDYIVLSSDSGLQISSSYANDWVDVALPVDVALTNGFAAVTCDNDCGSIYAVGHYQTPVFSIDYGMSWNSLQSLPPQKKWNSIACNSDCSVIFAIASDSDSVYVSTDSAASFIQSPPIGLNLTDIDCNTDGSIAVVVQYNGFIFVSNNSGHSWFTASGISSSQWTSVTVSSSGQYMAACAFLGTVVVSHHFGTNWTDSGVDYWRPWSSISADSTGQYLVVSASTEVSQSSNYGSSWYLSTLTTSSTASINVVASSGNGQMLYAALADDCPYSNNRSTKFPIPQAEFDALLDFYHATVGEEWINTWPVEGATLSSPCEGWFGVTCSFTDSSANVYMLSMQNNNLKGTLPESLGNLTEMYSLSLQSSSIGGSIPSTVGRLTKLNTFQLSYTNIGGTIPDSVRNMVALVSFFIVDCPIINPIPFDAFAVLPKLAHFGLEQTYLTGPVPKEVSSLQNLEFLFLSSNKYTGPIPEEIWTMNTVSFLMLDNNSLTGSISDGVYQMTMLNNLYLQNNKLNGTIPKWIGNISDLSALTLNNNELTGSVPESLCNAVNLMSLSLSNNFFTSSLPLCLGDLPVLSTLNLDQNHFTSSIPAFFGNKGGFSFSYNHFSGELPSINAQQFLVSYNSLSGSIPFAYVNISYEWVLDHNHFSGSLPAGSCFNVRSPYSDHDGCAGVDVSYNHLTGALPEGMHVWNSVFLNDNHFTGTIAESFVETTVLCWLVLNNNLFSGTLPASFGQMKQIADMYLNNNKFTGTLSPSIFTMNSVFSLLLNNNQFTGNLNELIDASLDPSQSVLVNVDVSDNQFSGSIPGSIFEVVTLQSFAANSNCMDGSIPGEVCGALNLTTLLLDGVVAASACQTKYRSLVSGSSIYVAEKSLSGGVPECLFHLPKLATLHLSGNGLSGRVPPMVSLTDQSSASSAALSNSLTELSLSYNRLTGRIPESIQMYPWSSLDLSYNRLDGDLMSGGFQSGGGSGSSQQSVSLQVNRLSGEVPVGLVESSGDVNVLDGNMFHCNINKNQIPSRDPNYGSYECGSYSFDVSAILWGCAQLFPVSCLIYLLAVKGGSFWDVSEQTELRDKHLAHLDNYVLVSGLSVRVRQSIVVVMGFITCIVLPVCAVLSLKYDSYEYEYSWSASGIYMSGVVPAVVLLVLLIVLLVILKWSAARIIRIDPSRLSEKTVAMDAVVSTSRPKEMVMIACIVLLNAIVLLGVNVAYVVIANRSNTSAVFVTQLCMAYFKLTWNRFFVLKALSNLVRYYPESKGLVDRWMVTIELCMMVFNNMVAPFVAVALVDANCFKDIVDPPPNVVSEYFAMQCQSVNTVVVKDSVVLECVHYSNILQQSSFAPPFTYSYQCSSSYIALYSNIFVLMFTSTAVLVPLRNELSRWCMSRCEVGSVWWHVANVFCSRLACSPSSLLFLRHSTPPRDAHFIRLLRVLAGKIETLFKANVFVVDITSMLVIILTFGTVVPLIGIIGCITLCCYTYYAQYCIVRFSNECDKCKTENITVYFMKMNSQFHLVQDQLSHVMSIIVPWMCVFYAFLLFDTMGSAVGAMRAMWLPVGLVCGLLLVQGVSRLWRGWSGDKRVQRARMYKPLIESSAGNGKNSFSGLDDNNSDVVNALNEEI